MPSKLPSAPSSNAPSIRTFHKLMAANRSEIGALQQAEQLLRPADLAVQGVGKLGERLISPRRGDAKARVNEEDMRAPQGGKRREGLHQLAEIGRAHV